MLGKGAKYTKYNEIYNNCKILGRARLLPGRIRPPPPYLRVDVKVDSES